MQIINKPNNRILELGAGLGLASKCLIEYVIQPYLDTNKDNLPIFINLDVTDGDYSCLDLFNKNCLINSNELSENLKIDAFQF